MEPLTHTGVAGKPSSTRRGFAALRRPAVWLPLSLAAAALAFALLWVPFLTAVGELLSVEDPIAPADYLYVLGGEPETRSFLAADLYHAGVAPRLLVPQVQENTANELGIVPTDTEVSVGLLRAKGVPDSAIVVLQSTPGGVSSTRDEAVQLREFLEPLENPRIIAVTSWYHTRRTRWNLRRGLNGIDVDLRVAGAEHPVANEHNWWRSEDGLVLVFQEYIKFLHNWIYG